MHLFFNQINSLIELIDKINTDRLYSIIFAWSFFLWPVFVGLLIYFTRKIIPNKIKVNFALFLLYTFSAFCLFLVILFFYNRDAEGYLAIFLLISAMIAFSSTEFFLFGDIKDIKPFKFKLKFEDYSSYSKYLEEKLINDKYELIDRTNNIKLYKLTKHSFDYFIVDAKYEAFTQQSSDEIYDLVMKYIPKDKFFSFKRTRIVMLIISVDKLTSHFNTLLSNEIQQEKYYYFAQFGISFGGKKIYIPDNPIGTSAFHNRERYFIKLLNITKEDKIK